MTGHTYLHSTLRDVHLLGFIQGFDRWVNFVHEQGLRKELFLSPVLSHSVPHEIPRRSDRLGLLYVQNQQLFNT